MRSVYQETINELEEVIASGGLKTLRSSKRTLTPFKPVKEFTPHEIKSLRERNQYTQLFFGELLGVSPKTIQAWEAGTNKPNGTAHRMFGILEQNPHALDTYILEA